MTLPGLIEQALKARYSDNTLKLVYPVGAWSLQAAAGTDRLILTLATPDDSRFPSRSPRTMPRTLRVRWATARSGQR